MPQHFCAHLEAGRVKGLFVVQADAYGAPLGCKVEVHREEEGPDVRTTLPPRLELVKVVGDPRVELLKAQATPESAHSRPHSDGPHIIHRRDRIRSLFGNERELPVQKSPRGSNVMHGRGCNHG